MLPGEVLENGSADNYCLNGLHHLGLMIALRHLFLFASNSFASKSLSPPVFTIWCCSVCVHADILVALQREHSCAVNPKLSCSDEQSKSGSLCRRSPSSHFQLPSSFIHFVRKIWKQTCSFTPFHICWGHGVVPAGSGSQVWKVIKHLLQFVVLVVKICVSISWHVCRVPHLGLVLPVCEGIFRALSLSCLHDFPCSFLSALY